MAVRRGGDLKGSHSILGRSAFGFGLLWVLVIGERGGVGVGKRYARISVLHAKIVVFGAILISRQNSY